MAVHTTKRKAASTSKPRPRRPKTPITTSTADIAAAIRLLASRVATIGKRLDGIDDALAMIAARIPD